MNKRKTVNNCFSRSEVHRVRADQVEYSRRRYATHEWTVSRKETKLSEIHELKTFGKKQLLKQKAPHKRDPHIERVLKNTHRKPNKERNEAQEIYKLLGMLQNNSSSPRSISIVQLNTLLCLHLRPIKLVVYK